MGSRSVAEGVRAGVAVEDEEGAIEGEGAEVGEGKGGARTARTIQGTRAPPILARAFVEGSRYFRHRQRITHTASSIRQPRRVVGTPGVRIPRHRLPVHAGTMPARPFPATSTVH